MAEPQEGQLVTNNIRLLRPLGAGGMGAVWLADHLALHTQVVVKFISDELAKNADALMRFKREAAAASQVKSPHVVQTLDHGIRDDGVPFIVMEHLEGHDLADHIDAHGKMSKQDVVAVVSQLSRALMRAHEKNIIHRDIKPSNVFLCDAGGGELFVKLLDFGIAKGGAMPKLDENTKTGAMVGSPHYMSPEQIIGDKNVDYRSDLWSLGVVAFEAMTGSKPFDADTVGGLALKIHNTPLPTPSSLDASIPASVDAWFERACARDPSGRFEGAKEMAEALSAAFLGSTPARSMAPSPLSGSGNRDIELAKTALDSEPASMRSNESSGSTGVGVAARVPTPQKRPRWLFPAIGGAFLVLVVVAIIERSKVHTVSVADGHKDNATSDAVRVTPPIPTMSALPTIATSASVAPSANASAALPQPTAHLTAKPTATKTVNPDDDIK